MKYRFHVGFTYLKKSDDFREGFGSYFEAPYEGLKNIFNDGQCNLQLTESFLKQIREVINGDLDSFSIAGQYEVYVIVVFKDRSQIQYVGEGSKFLGNSKNDGSDRNSLHPENERISTEIVLKLLEDWHIFLKKTNDMVYVEKEKMST